MSMTMTMAAITVTAPMPSKKSTQFNNISISRLKRKSNSFQFNLINVKREKKEQKNVNGSLDLFKIKRSISVRWFGCGFAESLSSLFKRGLTKPYGVNHKMCDSSCVIFQKVTLITSYLFYKRLPTYCIFSWIVDSLLHSIR